MKSSTMNKTRIDLDILLPEVPDERDECVARLVHALEGRSGIQKVHVVSDEGKEPQLCFHYDPSYITIEKVAKLAKSAGAEITKKYGHVLLHVDGIRHQRHARLIEGTLKNVPGVLTGSVSGTGIIQIEFDQAQTNIEKIKSVFAKTDVRVASVEDVHAHGHEHAEGHEH